MKKHTNIDKTAQELRAMAQECGEAWRRSVEDSDTDGFLSQAANTHSRDLYNMQAGIKENGGVWPFDALFKDGELVAAKLIQTRDFSMKYGNHTKPTWGILENDDPRSKVVKWIDPKNVEKHGYTVGTVQAKAWAGTGARSRWDWYVEIYRMDGGFSRDVEVVEIEKEKVQD